MSDSAQDELVKMMETLDRRRARVAEQKARYRAKHREKLAAANKRYRENNREKVFEAKKRYRETHREQLRAKERQYRETHREQAQARRRRYRLNHPERDKESKRQCRVNQRKRDKEKKRTVEKVKALGPLELTVTLIDYLKSPCVDTPVVTFCQSLEADDRTQPSVETYIESFCQLLDDDSWTLANLDSGDIQAAEPPVWDQWLEDLMEDIGDLMEDPSSLEDSLNLWDLLEDMTPDEWTQVIEDALQPFDLDAFVT